MKSQFLGPIRRFCLWFSQTITRIGKRFFKEGYTYTAGSLTYTSILALVPVTIVSMMILSVLPTFQKIIIEVQNFLIKNFVPEVGETIRENLNMFVSQAKNLPLPGIIFLFILAILMLMMVERALNTIWRVPGRRKGMATALRYWAIISLAPLFIGVSIWATTELISAPLIRAADGRFTVSEFLVVVLPFLLTVIAFTVLYVIVPNCRVPWRFGFISAVFVALILELAKKVFIFYMTSFPTYKVVYGAFATIPIFLLWIFIAWNIILIGGLLSNELTMQSYNRKSIHSGSTFSSVLVWLAFLWNAQKKGQSVSFVKLYSLSTSEGNIAPEVQLATLLDLRIIKIIAGSQVMLCRDMHSYSLKKLYQELPWKFSGDAAGHLHETVCQELTKAEKQFESALDIPLSKIFERKASV